MSRVQVKKVVAVLFLESAKLTLDHIAEYRLEPSNSGVTGAAELPRIYGEVRRLRDYLQRCLSGHQETVALEISPPDCALLVACCRRMYEWLDQRIVSEQIMSADEKALVQRKRQVLGDWSVELAEKPLLELPVPGIGKTQSEGVRALRTRISNKLFKQRVIPGVGQQGPRGPQMSAGVSLMGDLQIAQQPGPFEAAETGASIAPTQSSAQPPVEAFAASQLVDATKLRDPRLRSLVQLDLRSFDRAVECKDYRIATVLLGCVLESVMLDFVIQKRSELGIGGGPETWNLPELLIKAMGTAFTPHDRSSSFHLFAARNLLRPALQITTPTVVTAATLQKLQEFVQRAFRSLGFTSMDQGARGTDQNDPYSMYGLRFDQD